MDAAYTIRYDWALESDRVGWMLGAETTFLEDFLREVEAPPEVDASDNEDNITDLKAWITEVNRKMTAGR